MMELPTNPAPQVLEKTGFLPILPMLYLAWADGDLNPSELQAFREIVDQGDLFKPESKPLIYSWLQPEHPPSSADLFRLLRRIRQVAAGMNLPERESLVSLGLSLCHHESPEISQYWHDSANLQALAELETSLGITNHEALFEILGTRSKPPEPFGGLSSEPEPAFSPAKLCKTLDGRYHQTIEDVRQMLHAPIFNFSPEDSKEIQREKVMQWLALFAEKGLGSKAYPEVMKTTHDLGAFMAAFETLAFFDLSLTVKMGVQFGLFGGSIYFLGTNQQRNYYLPKVATGQLLGCFAMSELGHGSNVRDLLTTATYQPETDTWDIHTPTETGRKEWIGGAAKDAELATVFAQLIAADGTSQGVHAFLVPIRDRNGNPKPGIRIADCGHKMGLNGVDNGIIWFDHVQIPRENLLARFAQVNEQGAYESSIASSGKRFFTMLGTLVGGRVSVAAAAVSVSKTALAIAIRYSAMRRQFGPDSAQETPILDYPIHQRRLIPRLATTYALHFAVRNLVDCYTGRIETPSQTVEAMAAAIKATATWHNNQTVQECRERCGGQGFLSVNRLPALKADSDVFATFEGDNIVLMQLVAKSVLTDFRRQFADNKFRGALRLLSHKVNKWVGTTSFVNSFFDTHELRSPIIHRDLFRARETHLTYSLATRLRKRLKKGIPLFEAFKQCQNHAVSLAMAYADRLIQASFHKAVTEEPDQDVQKHLKVLCELYGLVRVEQDLAWFYSNKILSPDIGKKIPKLITQVCHELRPQAVHLVNAFAIPDNCLAAPIAFEKNQSA